MKFLASKILANSLLLIFSIYLSIATLWSEQKLLDSPIVLVLAVVFIINLAACTFQQILRIKTSHRWGLCILHIGLVLLTLSYGYNYLGKGEGHRFLGIGQSMDLSARDIYDWTGGKLAQDWNSGQNITMRDISMTYGQKGVTLQGGTIAYRDKLGNLKEGTLRARHSLKIGDAKLYVLERGFSPLLNWNNHVFYWSMSTKRLKNGEEKYQENLKNGNMEIQGEYFPGGPDGKTGILNLAFEGKNYELKPGDSVDIRGNKLTWQDTGYWIEVKIALEPGIYMIGISTILIILGSAIYYIPQLWKREKYVI